MKVLITGVAGLIGSYIAEQCLDRGYEVVGVDNLFRGTEKNMNSFINDRLFSFQEVNMIQIENMTDVYDEEGHYRPDVIFNMGAVVPTQFFYEDIKQTFMANVVGTYRMIRFAQENGVGAFIHGSSSEIYGHQKEFPTPETANMEFDNPLSTSRWSYACGKLLTEYLLNQTKGINPISMRFGNVYGERDTDEEHVIPRFIGQALRGEDLQVDYTPARRTFVHGRDCADACILAMDKGLYYSAYNIGGVEDITMTTLAEEIIRLTDSESQIVPGIHRPGNPGRRVLDTTRARIELGWEQKIRLEKGLSHLAGYMRGLHYMKEAEKE